MKKRLNDVIRLMQISHIVLIGGLLIFALITLFFNYNNLVIEYDSKEFYRRISKITIGFLIGIAVSHLIPFYFFWKKATKKTFTKKVKLFLNGSFWQWGLLSLLGVSLLYIFFIYSHIFVGFFFLALIVILLAKRPSHYRLYDKTKVDKETIKKYS